MSFNRTQVATHVKQTAHEPYQEPSILCELWMNASAAFDAFLRTKISCVQ